MAQRLSAQPRSKDYGSLTLMVQSRYRVEYLRTVPASVFLPRPEVDSAFIRISPRPADEFPNYDAEAFAKLVRKGFSQRRKQLQKLLREEVGDWSGAAQACGFEPTARAEELSLTQWIGLTNFAARIDDAGTQGGASEPFVVVDEADRVVGQASRATVHGNNLLHRAVHILLFNRRNEIFLQKRSRLKDRHPCLWDSSAAGHVDAGEDYDAAAARELREELGVNVPVTRVVKLPASERTGQEFIWLYEGRHDGPFELARSEIELGDFFPLDLVTAWLNARPDDFAPGFAECWKAFLARGPRP